MFTRLPQFIATLFVLIFPGTNAARAIADELADIPIVDTHVHLWDLKRPKGLSWIAKDDKFLYRTLLPDVHQPIARANNVQGVVVVQAGQSLPDNQWNLDITAHNTQLYRGIVGNLSEVIGTDKFKPLFEKLCKDKRYVGYRLSGRYQKGTLSEELIRDLKQTAAAGRTVDFLLGGYSLDDVAKIARRVPNLKIILDHFCNVMLSNQPLDVDWIKSFRATAKHKNVFCKVSALYGRVKPQPAPRNIEFYKPVLDLAFECFTEDRLVFGSDWPVTRASGDYTSVVKLTRAYFDSKGRVASEKLFYRNAVRFYEIQSPTSLRLRAMTFNIRNGRARDGENKWDNRKDFVCDVIDKSASDIVGLQEAFRFQLDHIGKRLPQYAEVGEGCDGGKRGEFSAILYRKDRFELQQSDTFWLSDSPKMKSKNWGNRYLRVCTWARLRDKSSKRSFYVFNTHFDHQSQNARIKSARLISKRISARSPGGPFLLMGDFNAGEDNEVIRFLKNPGKTTQTPADVVDTFRVLRPDAIDVGTGGGFKGKRTGKKIDYIFVPSDARTLDAAIIRTQIDGRYPSDHFPVTAEVEFSAIAPD